MKLLLDFLRWLFRGRFGSSRKKSLPAATKWAKRRPVKLTKRRRLSGSTPPAERPKPIKSVAAPYLFGAYASDHRQFLDLSLDGDDSLLASYHLPVFHTPQELADWLGIRIGELAWLVHRSASDRRPETEQRSHYVYRWVKKRTASLEAGSPNSRPVSTQWRLIEAPKKTLKTTQRKILAEILAKIPAHQAAHGFVRGRSIVSNARPHVGQAVVIKLDLQNFYANVTYSRVVAIFRSMGYCREAAIWLGRLTTSAVPWTLTVPDGDEATKSLYLRRHLPQGAPTSPANESFGLRFGRATVGVVEKVWRQRHTIRRRPDAVGQRRLSICAPLRHPVDRADRSFGTLSIESPQTKSRAARTSATRHRSRRQCEDQHLPCRVRPAQSDPDELREAGTGIAKPRRSRRLRGASTRPRRLRPSTQSRAGREAATAVRPNPLGLNILLALGIDDAADHMNASHGMPRLRSSVIP